MTTGRIKFKDISLNERTFIIGDAELMGYVGVKTSEALKAKFFNRGLVPTSVIGKTKYYRRTMVDRFIVQHDEQNKSNKIKLL